MHFPRAVELWKSQQYKNQISFQLANCSTYHWFDSICTFSNLGIYWQIHRSKAFEFVCLPSWIEYLNIIFPHLWLWVYLNALAACLPLSKDAIMWSKLPQQVYILYIASKIPYHVCTLCTHKTLTMSGRKDKCLCKVTF